MARRREKGERESGARKRGEKEGVRVRRGGDRERGCEWGGV